MSTQTVNAIVGNSKMSRSFTDTATDGVFQSNLMLSSLSGTNLGLEMPGEVIDFVSVEYTAGACLWRIQDSNSLKTERIGFATKAGGTCYSSTKIAPFKVKPTSLLQVYPMAVASASNDTVCLAWVSTNKGPEPFGVTTSADATLTEMTSLISSMTLGDYAFGQILTSVTLQCEDGATLPSIAILNQTAGTEYQQKGTTRQQAGSISNYYNLKVNVSIPIQKGWSLKVAATSA